MERGEIGRESKIAGEGKGMPTSGRVVLKVFIKKQQRWK